MKRSGRQDRRRQKMLQAYTIALAALSLSLFVMPIAYQAKKLTRVPMYIAGVAFWVMLIATIAAAVRINLARRKSVSFSSEFPGLRKLALIHFFQNKMATIMDIAMLAMLIAFVIAYFLQANLVIQFLFISLFVFSFGMHCMLNGINYIFIKQKNKR